MKIIGVGGCRNSSGYSSQASQKLKEVIVKKEQEKYIKGFTWTKKAWYCHDPDLEKTIYFGLYHEKSEYIGKIVMTWDDFGCYFDYGASIPHLEIGKEGWKLLSSFSDLFDKIASLQDGPTQEEFIDILLSLGFKDRTEYEDPLGSKE